MLVAKASSKIKAVFISNVDFVFDTDSAEHVASVMQKYDLGAIPVVEAKEKPLWKNYN